MVNKSWRIGVFFGIPVKIHWTFTFILLYAAGVGWQEGFSPLNIGNLMLIFLIVFLCVVLHEFGHALSAKRFGIETEDIILTPIGGIARLHQIPENPKHEMIVALAGPSVNLAIIAILALLIVIVPNLTFLPQYVSEEELLSTYSAYPALMVYVNAMLFGFNMIPAFPMDGGRVLRAILSIKWSRTRATLIASIVGQIITAIFVVIGLVVGHWTLIFIGVYIFFSARREYRLVRLTNRMRTETAREHLLTELSALNLSSTLEDVRIRMRGEGRKNRKESGDFLVLHDQHSLPPRVCDIAGVLHREYIEDAIDSGVETKTSTISTLVQPNWEPIVPSMTIESVLQLFQTNPYSILPVVSEQSEVIGILTRHGVQQLITDSMYNQALRSKADRLFSIFQIQ